MKKEWKKEEIEFLLKNYLILGVKKCATELQRGENSIKKKAAILGLNFKSRRYNKEVFIEIIKNSRSYSDAVRKLSLKDGHGNRKTVIRYIEIYKIDISHFDFKGDNIGGNRKKLELKQILIKNSTYSNIPHLKERLYKEGLKERKCELCGQDENWYDKKISLILDHKNGVHNDNRFENLRIVCPNCNAALETHCRGSVDKRTKLKKINEHRFFCSCGEEIWKGSKTCKSCNEKLQRKIIRPPYLELMEELKKSNYTAVGRKYGVSDNSIRKWVENYENKLK